MAKTSDWQARLNAAKGQFISAQKEAKANLGSHFIVSPEGSYISLLQKCEVKESPKIGAFLYTEHKIIEAEDSDRIGEINKVIYQFEGRDEKEQERLINNLVRFVVTMGYEFDPDDIAGTIQEMAEELELRQVSCRITIKYNPNPNDADNPFRNLYINRVVDEGSDEPAPKKAMPKPTTKTPVATTSKTAETPEPKKRGRPAGAINKPKEGGPTEDVKPTVKSRPAPVVKDDEEDDELALLAPEIGMRGEYTTKDGDTIEAEIIEILEDEEKLRIKGDNGKTYKIPGEKFVPLIDEDEEDEDSDSEEDDEDEEEEE